MINILKPGKVQKKEKCIFTITCPHCGCKFECSHEDFMALSRSINNQHGWIKCPNCQIELDLELNKLKYRMETVTTESTEDNTNVSNN